MCICWIFFKKIFIITIIILFLLAIHPTPQEASEASQRPCVSDHLQPPHAGMHGGGHQRSRRGSKGELDPWVEGLIL